jgi:hypothetical protein
MNKKRRNPRRGEDEEARSEAGVEDACGGKKGGLLEEELLKS